MQARTIISCNNKSKDICLNLSESVPSLFDLDYVNCPIVFEDGVYKLKFIVDNLDNSLISSIDVYINDSLEGYVLLERGISHTEGMVVFQKGIKDGYRLDAQPFLLLYDQIIISFRLTYKDGSKQDLYSNYLLCVSKSKDDIENINIMLENLMDFDESKISELLFTNENASLAFKSNKNTYNAYRSLNSYLKLLEVIMHCYKSNYSYFKKMRKHTIKKDYVIESYQNVKSITGSSFRWLMQNSSNLSEIYVKQGIEYQGKHYLPLNIKSEINKKSYDVYENFVVVHFLHTVLFSANKIYKEFEQSILEVEKDLSILDKINSNLDDEYKLSIFTIKSLQISFCRNILNKFKHTLDSLMLLYHQYVLTFDIKLGFLENVPRKTKTFQEIKPYAQIFMVILKWFDYGDFNVDKDKFIMQIKTLDKLYEYFCLIELLHIFIHKGFEPYKEYVDNDVDITDVDTENTRASFNFNYKVCDHLYQNETDLANTYYLKKDDIDLCIYYQPVISGNTLQNDINLYRTTRYLKDSDYYSPDFIIKFKKDNKEQYIILDCKFSTRRNIENIYLSDVLRKYSHELDTISDDIKVKMVWILQGRVNIKEDSLYRYHNSPLAKQYKPKTSFGIFSLNSLNSNDLFWDEITYNIDLLDGT